MARSITLAMFSRPCEILMLSTAVSICGKVLSTCSGFMPRLEGRVALRIERFGVGHAAGHPEHDDGVGGGIDFFFGFGEQLARETRGERGERGGAGGLQEIAARPDIVGVHKSQ